MVSLTGRNWDQFDEALISGYGKIGILTDNKTHTPSDIAQRMLDYGYDNYQMFIGELLGNREKEKVAAYSLQEVAAGKTFAFPNNILLLQTYIHPRPLGIPENEFHLLNGRIKMITKMPVRLVSLSMLELRNKSVCWDIGSCTGSVSVEAKLQFPHLKIVAFEKRAEGRQLLELNARKFGTPGIETITGDFTEIDISGYPRPDAVFIGGHSGKMTEIITRIKQKLNDNGTIVFNSVSEDSRNLFLKALETNNLQLNRSLPVKVSEHNTIEIMQSYKK
jgi:precorrin-6Y C5,15-methyltransferase (decarboxylating)